MSGLLSATLLPGSSELLLLYRLQSGAPPWSLLLSVTAGNVIGSVITYGMGRGGYQLLQRRVAELQRAERWFQRWGSGVVLLAWLPVVGDPICLVAGLLRLPLVTFLLWVTLGKMGRYAALIVAEQWLTMS